MPHRFNTPPGWPPTPPGWQPPAGWQPDPSWPDPPPGWQLWVEEAPPAAPRHVTGPGLAVTGTIAVLVSGLLPWFPDQGTDYTANWLFSTLGITYAAVYGVPMLALAAAAWHWTTPSAYRRRRARGIATVLVVLSILAIIGYGALIFYGAAGFFEQSDQADGELPGFGLIVGLVGGVMAFIGAMRTLANTK